MGLARREGDDQHPEIREHHGGNHSTVSACDWEQQLKGRGQRDPRRLRRRVHMGRGVPAMGVQQLNTTHALAPEPTSENCLPLAIKLSSTHGPLTEIQDLIKFIAKAGVTEVEIEKKDFKITIKSEMPKKKGASCHPWSSSDHSSAGTGSNHACSTGGRRCSSSTGSAGSRTRGATAPRSAHYQKRKTITTSRLSHP